MLASGILTDTPAAKALAQGQRIPDPTTNTYHRSYCNWAIWCGEGLVSSIEWSCRHTRCIYRVTPLHKVGLRIKVFHWKIYELLWLHPSITEKLEPLEVDNLYELGGYISVMWLEQVYHLKCCVIHQFLERVSVWSSTINHSENDNIIYLKHERFCF